MWLLMTALPFTRKHWRGHWAFVTYSEDYTLSRLPRTIGLLMAPDNRQ